MLKRVQKHDSKRGTAHSCHPEPGPELASGFKDFGISVLVLNHLGLKALPLYGGALYLWHHFIDLFSLMSKKFTKCQSYNDLRL